MTSLRISCFFDVLFSGSNKVIFSPPIIILAVDVGVSFTRICFFLMAFLMADFVATVLKIPTAYS